MVAEPAVRIPDFAPSALAASNVGLWYRDLATGLVHSDAVMAGIFGLTPAEAEGGAPLARYRDAILPQDRPIFDRKNAMARERGGLIVIEYRVSPLPGVVRWVLARGRYEPARGARGASGRGIVIDITESKADGHVEDKAFFARPSEDEDDVPLLRAVDHAVALHRAIDAMEESVPGLTEAVKLALLLLGRRLARDTPRGGPEGR